MQPLTPEKRCGSTRVVYAKDQPQYKPLPANAWGSNGRIETKWKLSFKEWLHVLFHGTIYITLLTFNQPLQPIATSILREKE